MELGGEIYVPRGDGIGSHRVGGATAVDGDSREKERGGGSPAVLEGGRREWGPGG